MMRVTTKIMKQQGEAYKTTATTTNEGNKKNATNEWKLMTRELEILKKEVAMQMKSKIVNESKYLRIV